MVVFHFKTIYLCILYNMSVEIQHITKLFGQQKALDDVSLSIGTGEIVGLLGPNGAGKSTLMKILTGFISQTSGNILINQHPMEKNEVKIRKEIGYLPENNPLYTEMYVREYLELTGRIYKLEKNLKARVMEVIGLTGLTPEQGKKIGALSKGFRQRVGLAQALIHNPSVLILDEPTSGLDPNQIVEIRNLISLTGKEKTILLSTHIMQEVEAICNRVVIINKGKIIADKPAGQLHAEAPDEKQTVLVEFRETVSKKLFQAFEAFSAVQKMKENTFIIRGLPDEDVRPVIFRFAVENKLTVLSMQEQEKSLEEIFRLLTSEE